MQNIDIFNPPRPQSQQKIQWLDLHGSSIALTLANLIKKAEKPIILVAPDNLSVSRLYEELKFFLGGDDQLIHFPDWETLPYDHFSPHQDIISERLLALFKLPQLKSHALLTTVSTIIQRLPPQSFIDQFSFMVKKGDQINVDILKTRLVKSGYRNVPQVREHGEFAIRGSLVDLYPMGSNLPFRLDLFDNEIDSIRLFSVESQRSLEVIDEINLLPAKEFPLTEEGIELFRTKWRQFFPGNPLNSPIYQDISEGIGSPGIEYYLPLFFEQTASFFEYLPEESLIVTIGDYQTKATEFWHDITERYTQAQHDLLRPLLPPETIFIPAQQLFSAFKKYAQIIINPVQVRQYEQYSFATSEPPALEINYKEEKPLKALEMFTQNAVGNVIICAESMGRKEVLTQLFQSFQFTPTYFESWNDYLVSPTAHAILVGALEEGFKLQEPPLTLLTEAQLYNKKVMQRRLRKQSIQDPDLIIRDLTELKVGDPVVHINHGIGRYLGLKTLTVGDRIGEFLTLAYQNNDKLYVPVASLHLISRYSGADAEHTPINKLGTDQWQRAKRRAAEKVKDVAAELLELYAKRAARPGHNYQIPKEQYEAFAASFPFEETPDQLQAIHAVFQDMTSDKPMDRVVCGDVGFGKTEVAMRAAFIAVQNGKQVILLVPTTLLAQQHFQNFQDRFANSAIQIEMLSRFRTPKQQQHILERLAEGKVDIVIGTHKLLQSDIKLKDLGLIIIDEEHRFGVKQKEKLKSLRTIVDILTLTATPIPRTLNMALAGIRDLSVIASPPAKRLSVKTFVHEYQKHIIQEAIQREILRGGQVYFLHNDVTSINNKAEEITKLVPEARPAIAHGQMHERDLERVMTEFYHRKHNVLVCSTIIESGIDVPTANTIIINRADKLGLAQLHQLRGRVGRSHHQAYAYLLIPPRDMLTADAEKRLDAIASLDTLGVGFTLATHDLEIRGAGELLGEEQSGEMHEVGFTLYMDLLSRAVAALKAGKNPDLENAILAMQQTEIDLKITALIPDTFIQDVQIRLNFYKRIANAKNNKELDDLQIEMIDRFGLLPEALKNLFAMTELKLLAEAKGIIKLEANEKGGKIEFSNHAAVNPETIIKLIQAPKPVFKLDGSNRLKFYLTGHDIKQRIDLVKHILGQLE